MVIEWIENGERMELDGVRDWIGYGVRDWIGYGERYWIGCGII
jgi:hypothetical protein